MSYILNALRKSEQERRNKEPETLQHRIAEIQPQANARTSRLILALIGVNIALLGYFIWDHYRQQPAVIVPDRVLAQAEPQSIKDTSTSSSEVVVVQPSVVELEPERAQSPQRVPRIEDKPLPTAEIKQESVETARPIAAAKKTPPQVLAKSEPVPEPVSSKPPITRNPSNVVARLALPPEVEDVRDVSPVKSPVISPATNPVPYMNELPYEFRKRIPPFDINVFVYSERVADSFVMIDMEKYKVGQRIKDELELKEIRPDSLVVRYQDQIFQIKRP